MIFAPPPEFGFYFHSHETTRPSATWGELVTASGSADTYGSYTEIISDADLTEDCYGIAIWISSAAVSAAISRGSITIGKDEAGGTSYSDWLTDLICGNAQNILSGNGGNFYYFPMFIKAGTSIAAKYANSTGSRTCRVAIAVVGRPLGSDVRAATKFESFGASVAAGTAITPANASEGSWTQIGSNPSTPLWWWQYGYQIANATINLRAFFVDIAVGDGSNKHIIIENQHVLTDSTEALYHGNVARLIPCYEAAVGDLIYARVNCDAAPDASNQIAIYGCG